ERARPREAAHPLPDDWTPSPDEQGYGTGLGFTPVEVEGMAEDLRLWARASGAVKRDWGATFMGWMRRDQRERSARKHAPPGSLPVVRRRRSGADIFAALAREADDNIKRRQSVMTPAVIPAERPESWLDVWKP
ncbi:MAG: hypothetical protein ABW026_19160, partial [Microvirga sp.]